MNFCMACHNGPSEGLFRFLIFSLQRFWSHVSVLTVAITTAVHSTAQAKVKIFI